MKRFSRPVWIGFGVAGVVLVIIVVLSVITLTGSRQVAVKEVQAPVSDAQKTVKASDPKKMETGAQYQTGWTQLEKSIEVSMSSPEDCIPGVEKVIREGTTVTIYLQGTKSDCSNTNIITYRTIEDAANIQHVYVFEAGYPTAYEIFKLGTVTTPSVAPSAE